MASQTENLHLQLLGTSLQDKETYFEQWRQTINGEIDDSNMNIIDRAYGQMADDIADLKYKPIAINSFTSDISVAEKGSAVKSIRFTYMLNKVPESLRIGDQEIQDPGMIGQYGIGDAEGFTEDTSWTLTATDNGSPSNPPKTVTKNATLTFLNKAYWGTNYMTESGFNNLVLSLEGSELTDTRARTFTVNAALGKYIWYAIPASFGTPIFKVGGFDGGFEYMRQISFTNASGYTEQYNLYRSTNASLGSTTVVVS